MFSLVVPIYNVERYISECLDSVARELRDDCEVILVDDGSPDRSIELIVERYSFQLNSGKFRLVRIENSGLGAARNVGVAAARGAYVGFLDSDDVLLPGYFDRIKEAIGRGVTDLVQFNCKRFSTVENIIEGPVLKCHSSSGIFQMDQVRNEIFGCGKWFAVTRVFRRSLLIDFPFVERVFYEDMMTIPFIFLGDYHIVLLDDCLYGYRANENSITSKHNFDQATMLFDFFKRISELPSCIAISILKIQIARTLSYFSAELNLKSIPQKFIVDEIKRCGRDKGVAKYLSIPDRVFFATPSAYFLLDRWRLRYIRAKLKVD